MTEPRQLAICRSYDELHAALRGRADELAVTRETIDAVSGLQAGYSAKLLAPVPIRGIGRESMGPLLGTLGLMLVVVEDVVALAKVQGRLTRSTAVPNVAQQAVVILKFSRRHMRKIAKLSAAGRMKKMPKWKRSRVARQAAKARWSKPRVIQISDTSPTAAPPSQEPQNPRPPRAGTGAAKGRAPRRSPSPTG